ncbi:MAG TPA: YciI family protein [Anaerolineales bacterium]|nr:YciI family protein [Anaerolineales bacterium]
MQYALLIYTNEAEDMKRSPEEQEANMAEYYAFTNEVQQAGKLLAGEALHPTHAAKTVSIRDGKTSVVDGPFAETKEQFGGYYVINAESIEEAVAWAAKIPGAREGRVEVRPVWVFE